MLYFHRQYISIKVKFIENKAKADKLSMLEAMQKATGAYFVGMVGHIATLYRPHPNKKDRKIRLPQKDVGVKTTS